jgi:hypothetical protein
MAISTSGAHISEIVASPECIDVLGHLYPLLLSLTFFVGICENQRMLALIEFVLAGFGYPGLRSSKSPFDTAQ